jgi:hypothetical protein
MFGLALQQDPEGKDIFTSRELETWQSIFDCSIPRYVSKDTDMGLLRDSTSESNDLEERLALGMICVQDLL